MRVVNIEVKNLNKLLKYFEDLGYEVVEGPHAILTDDSEIGVWYVYKNNSIRAEIMAHYVNSHYRALMNLSSSASDREVIEALISVKGVNLWRAPVEPVVITIYEDLLEEQIKKYSDDYESRDAIDAVNHYLTFKESKILKEVLSQFKLKKANT